MAWIFEVSVECGPTREAAEAVTRHFDGLFLHLPSGLSTTCSSFVPQGAKEGWWSLTVADGTSRSGYYERLREDGTTEYIHGGEVFETHEQMNGLVLALHEHFRHAPPFRYALIGYETEFFREWSELLEEDYTKIGFEGLILSEEAWGLLGGPAGFVSFTPGYVWRPFKEKKFYS